MSGPFDAIKVCPNCKKEADFRNTFCPHCGEKLPEDRPLLCEACGEFVKYPREHVHGDRDGEWNECGD